MQVLPTPSLEGDPPLACVRLGSAAGEQAWIDERIRDGIACSQAAIVRYRTPAVIYRRRGHDEAAVAARALQAGCELMYRRAGGGVVLAGPWMLGMHLFLPVAHPLSRLSHIESYRWLGQILRRSLVRLGLLARMANPTSIATHNAAAREAGLHWACFAGLSHGELLDTRGRKLLGLAQCRGRWGTLLSGGLLLAETPWETLEFVQMGQRPERSGMHRLASPGLASLAPRLATEGLCTDLLNGIHKDLQGAEMKFAS